MVISPPKREAKVSRGAITRERGSRRSGGSSRRTFPSEDVASEPRRVLGELEIHAVVLGTHGGDLGDDDGEVVALERLHERLPELDRSRHGVHALDSSAPG